jgi:hypothetical protein
LFREGTYPPLRGTFLRLQDSTGLLYLRGSVQFFESYPGMYVPRPLELSVPNSESTVEQLAREMLSLSKLNWNNTQFDGGEPITVRAARRVGDILKCVSEGGTAQASFRFYVTETRRVPHTSRILRCVGSVTTGMRRDHKQTPLVATLTICPKRYYPDPRVD